MSPIPSVPKAPHFTAGLIQWYSMIERLKPVLMLLLCNMDTRIITDSRRRISTQNVSVTGQKYWRILQHCQEAVYYIPRFQFNSARNVSECLKAKKWRHIHFNCSRVFKDVGMRVWGGSSLSLRPFLSHSAFGQATLMSVGWHTQC